MRRFQRGRTASALALAAALVTGLVVSSAGAASAAPAVVHATPTATPRPTTTPKPAVAAWPSGRALSAEIAGGSVLTLPAKDGLRDTTKIRIRSGAHGDVDLIAIAGSRVVHLADEVALSRVPHGWQRTVSVGVGTLTAGTWTLYVRRSTDHTIRAHTAAPLAVGSGEPVHVVVRPAQRTVYPYRDGVLDAIDSVVTVTDETGTPLPFTGRLLLDSAGKDRSATLSRAGTARIGVTGLPIGPATLVASVSAPAGTATRSVGVTLAPTAVGTARIGMSADTVQPVVDGLLDTVTLTTSGAAVAASPARVSGTLSLSLGAIGALGTTIVQQWRVPDGGPHTFSWDGRTGGVIVPGTYTVTLSLRGPEGIAKVKTKTLLVTKDHLPYRVQDLFTVAAGNQQGLAVHDGVFYVSFDNGGGTARIDEYNSSGAVTGSLGSPAIGHAAELSYSTTTNLLYAANGGASTPTTVWALDPTTGAVQGTFDLSALGPNGMVAVDDANARLIVFAGTPGAYTVTPVSMSDVTTTDDSGVTTISVPAGTPGTPVPIAITGMPQGIEMVGTELWVYTSLRKVNHIARYDLSANAALATTTGAASFDLANAGEGEGLGFDDPGNGQPPWIYVGAHSTNRVGVLQPVADE